VERIELGAYDRRIIEWAKQAQPTTLEMNGFLENHPGLRTSAEVASRLSSKSLLPASIIGLCHWIFSDLDPTQPPGSSPGLPTETASQPIIRSPCFATGSSRCASPAAGSTKPKDSL